MEILIVLIELLIGYKVVEPTLHTNKVFEDKLKNFVYRLNSFTIASLVPVNIVGLFVSSKEPSFTVLNVICLFAILFGLMIIASNLQKIRL